MQANPAALDDLESQWRSLTADETVKAASLLDSAWAQLNLLAPVDGLVDGSALQAVVISLLCTAVERVMMNPEKNKSESIDDYSFTRDDSVSAGQLYFTDAELALVRGATFSAASVPFANTVPVLSMGVTSVVGAGRAAAESRMTSTCTIRRAGTGSPDYGPDGDQILSSTTVYSGPCRVGSGSVRMLTVGDTQSEQATRTLHLPAGTTGLKDADVATIDSGDTAGLSLRLLEVTWQDQATALRIACVEN